MVGTARRVRLCPPYRTTTPSPSLRATGSRECAPDDKLSEAIHVAAQRKNGLLRCARNDGFEGPFMSPDTYPSWLIWALLSAALAALTAIFAKIGVEDINSDLATLIRTVVVLISLALILSGLGTGALAMLFSRAKA